MSPAGAGAWCGADGEVLMAEAREQPSAVPELCWHRTPGRTCSGYWVTGAKLASSWGGITLQYRRACLEPRVSAGGFCIWEQAL